MNALLVTGGAGFIGSNFIRHALRSMDAVVVNYDKLTYAGNLENVADVAGHARYRFVHGDICDIDAVRRACEQHGVSAIVNFAAESHVDRSIRDSAPFLSTNIDGVRVLLEVAKEIGAERFLQVSTDEVYGSIEAPHAVDERAPLHPGSPYAASKAAADLLCLAYANTHGLPVIISRCSNNYGPYQHPEKLIPLALSRAIAGEQIPLYGDGLHERDWLHVDDHCRALLLLLLRGRIGEIYNIATGICRSNVEVLNTLTSLVGTSSSLVRSVPDRPGHDRRYAPDPSKMMNEFAWRPQIMFADGVKATVEWYRDHNDWVRHALSGEYRNYFAQQYAALK